MRVRQRLLQGVALVIVLAAAGVQAQSYPVKPIRIIVPFGAGGPADLYARYLAQQMLQPLGQSMVVENRPGAGSIIGTDAVAKSPPDGYTLLLMSNTHTINESLIPKKPFTLMKDFVPVAPINYSDLVLVVHPSVPAKNVPELVALSKQRNLSYASAGNGTISHLTGELFKQVAKADVQHIPYKSAGFALTSILSGETQLSFLSPVTAYAQLKSGKVRALAVSSAERFPGAPDIPSATEAGIPGMVAELWFGLFTTAKTPKPIVNKLHKEITGILGTEEVKAQLLQRGAIAAPTTPEELHAFVKSELAKWTPIIKAAGIKAD